MTEIIDLEEIKPLFEPAALSMAGYPVPVYFRAPVIKGLQGQVIKETDGTLAIELLPIEDIEKLYKNFLHETSHIFLGHAKDLEPRNLPAKIVEMQEKGIQLLPASTDEEHEEYWNSPQELEARGFADYFYNFSKEKARFFYGDDNVKFCLLVCAKTTIQKGE